MSCRDCRKCEYFVDGLTTHKCSHPKINKELAYFHRNCEYYVLRLEDVIIRLNKRKRLLESFHVVDVEEDAEALSRAIEILRSLK